MKYNNLEKKQKTLEEEINSSKSSAIGIKAAQIYLFNDMYPVCFFSLNIALREALVTPSASLLWPSCFANLQSNEYELASSKVSCMRISPF